MSEQVASYGQAQSFTYLAAKAEFPGLKIMSHDDFGSLVRSVADETCSVGIAPFYNTSRNEIHDAQTAVRALNGSVFVTGVVAKPIEHALCGFGTLSTIREVRSKDVVFDQCSRELAKTLGGARQDGETYTNTAAAIESLKSLGDAERERIAAIGSAEAASHYGVPVINERMENPNNVTLFWKLSKNRPTVVESGRILILVTDATEEKLDSLRDEILEAGLRLSCAWRMGTTGEYFMEIDSFYNNLTLHSLVENLTARDDVILIGGYDDAITAVLKKAISPSDCN